MTQNPSSSKRKLTSTRSPFLWFFAICFGAFAVSAEVKRVEIEKRDVILDGKTFGEYGAYELLEGKIYFETDPANPMNHRIVDLQLAPRNESGMVESWANFVVLQPVDREKSRGVALVEVSNRGGKFSPRYYNRATSRTLAPGDEGAFGNALLMRQGMTVIWIGWQYDVPERPGVLRLHVPRAKNLDGSPITGLVRADWTLDAPAKSLHISHRNHLAYPVLDPSDSENILTVRNGRDAPRQTIPREKWRFAREQDGDVSPDSTHIFLEGGFQEGKIYELVYRAKDPAVVGLGLAAIRDVISYAKYDPDSEFPVKHGLAAGVSQTGRFLRMFLYQGFNTDEAARQAYDGLMIITAGAGRGSFNHRFAQPSRDAHRYSAFFYPTDIFPFTSAVQQDSETWRSDGLLAHMHNDGHVPKIFHINSGYEYWGRSASLIHLSPDGKTDVAPSEYERIYMLASGQHFVGSIPRTRNEKNVYRGNPLDFSVNYRALLVRLAEWAVEGKTPPANAYPKIADGTLVNIENVDFPKLKNAVFPKKIHTAYRADYGARWFAGVVGNQPPILGKKFIPKVSQVDKFGNEKTGVRNIEVRVPLATHTPWNLRHDTPGGKDELTDFRGTFIPLPKADAEKTRTNDPRQTIASLYANKNEYLEKVRAAAQELVREGFVLEEDVAYLAERAERYWSWMFEK